MELRIYEGDNAINKLIDDLDEDVASYCCDEAGLKDESSSDYEKCMAEDKNLQSIAIASMAYERVIPYSTDEGPVQMSMFRRLLDAFVQKDFCIKKDIEGNLKRHTRGNNGLCFNCENCLYSKDRMTNYGYTIAILNGLLENMDADSITDLAWNTARPSREGFFERKYLHKKKELRSKLKANVDDLKSLQASLNMFASNSSKLGNYCCIPKELMGLGLRGLNTIKGGVSTSFFIYSKTGAAFRINDQFALFLEWIENNKQSQDKEMLNEWKEAMLIDGCSGYYREAASHYKRAFCAETPEERIAEFAYYLNNVNKAIETRSRNIFETLRDTEKS